MSGTTSESMHGSSVQYWLSALHQQLAPIDGTTPYSPPDDVDRATELLANELGALQILMNQIRRRHNALTITATIPVEILIRISLFCLASDLRKPCLGKLATVMAFTHVCHRWRECALQTRELWVHLHPSFGRKWFVEVVERSHSAPLDLDLIWDKFPGRNGAPILESLEIEHAAEGNGPLCPPVELFTGSTPKLCCLSLTGLDEARIMLPKQIERMENLTCFKLDATDSFQSVDHFRHLLENMPNLQILTLKGIWPSLCRPDTSADPALPLPRILLPFLKDLNIATEANFVTSILAELRMTASSNVHIEYTGHMKANEHEAICSSLQTAIQDWLGVRPSTPPHRLSWLRVAYGHSRYAVWNTMPEMSQECVDGWKEEWKADGSLFPNLKNLWIRRIDLTSPVDLDILAAPASDVTGIWTSPMVLQRLISQQKSLFPLDTLYLMDSTMPSGWFEELSRAVTVQLGGDSQAPACMRWP
ncbi:hypothetical protein EVG20_g2655 [Dentipellis fragilis]|uniref:Uncharacterized protein n=1 Tax=Dentipellis fragilis TaxID=205917 RepID=A0A4Y9Z746_9AGAM|nr:hypothetical protein EVG20_g2655 [Dentipellis fragilis]